MIEKAVNIHRYNFSTERKQHEETEYGNWWWWSTTPTGKDLCSNHANQKEVKMNTWRQRAYLLVVLFCAARVHDFVMLGCPNTPAWMLAYHGSAGAVDLLLLYCAPFFISERLCDDIQATCLASIAANFVGFCAYMAYAPPSYYNALIEGICYVQLLRLLYVGRYDADLHRRAMVPGASGVGA